MYERRVWIIDRSARPQNIKDVLPVPLCFPFGQQSAVILQHTSPLWRRSSWFLDIAAGTSEQKWQRETCTWSISCAGTGMLARTPPRLWEITTETGAVSTTFQRMWVCVVCLNATRSQTKTWRMQLLAPFACGSPGRRNKMYLAELH